MIKIVDETTLDTNKTYSVATSDFMRWRQLHQLPQCQAGPVARRRRLHKEHRTNTRTALDERIILS